LFLYKIVFKLKTSYFNIVFLKEDSFNSKRGQINIIKDSSSMYIGKNEIKGVKILKRIINVFLVIAVNATWEV